MSIDIEILPAASTIISWGTIKNYLINSEKEPITTLLGNNPSLIQLKNHQSVAPTQILQPGESYYFNIAIPNTLSLMVSENDEYLDEVDYLEDYGHNLSQKTIHHLANQWQKAHHTYTLTSMAGRHKEEAHLFINVAVAIATACQGHIIVMNHNLFNLDIGVYSPEVFLQTKPKF